MSSRISDRGNWGWIVVAHLFAFTALNLAWSHWWSRSNSWMEKHWKTCLFLTGYNMGIIPVLLSLRRGWEFYSSRKRFANKSRYFELNVDFQKPKVDLKKLEINEKMMWWLKYCQNRENSDGKTKNWFFHNWRKKLCNLLRKHCVRKQIEGL